MHKKVLVTLTEGLQSKDLYISCVIERSCEMQESSGKKPDWHSVNREARKQLNKEFKIILSKIYLETERRLIGL